MGKASGFIDYERLNEKNVQPITRIKNYCEFHLPLSSKERQEQGARCMDCGIPFCQYGQEINGMPSGCPLNNMIPEWNDSIFRDNYEEALKRLLKTDPFPEFTSRVCPSPCEKACTCSLHGEAVSICENEKAIIENGFEKGLIIAKKNIVRTNNKIAIIGSGPSGLASAWELNRRGHQITIFERSDRFGGLLMYGIPNMKLNKKVVERRIDLMKEEGILFQANQNIDNEKKANELLDEYDAVVLACGASKPRDINVNGRDAEGIHFAVDFLTATTKSMIYKEVDENFINAGEKNVLVIGGGDTGNDCVGTSIRHGCKSITQLEMMPKPPISRTSENPWPEWPKVHKTDYGQEEAQAVFGQDPRLYETTVEEFIVDDRGQVKQAVLVKLEWIEDKETKRIQMQKIKGSEYLIDCDLVLIAAGFLGTQQSLAKAFNLELDKRSNIETKNVYDTNHNKIFTAGDARRGQSLVVWAIREGIEVAKVVDKYLMGYTNI